jgi:cytochrome oxidase Cu insertion factor (SCO1/SenC/PrrC family)
MSEQSSRDRATSEQPPVARRRGREAMRRAKVRRWRWIGIATATAVLVVAFAVIVATSHSRDGGRWHRTSVSVGQAAPDGNFTTVTGTNGTIAALRGHWTLVWLVTTWCTSCQAGTQLLASKISTFEGLKVHVIELELYRDLGQSGPSISSFATQFAGRAANNPDWTFGTASYKVTTTYDPSSQLEMYYLLDPSGQIRYVNAPLVSTLGALLQTISALHA